jgi:hypothetical protein
MLQVIQRRIDGQTDFYRGWSEYEIGFGDMTKEFWLGMYEVLPGVLDQSVHLGVNIIQSNLPMRSLILSSHLY